MDRYQRLEKPRPEETINENEIRITAQGLIRNYITYATTLLQGKQVTEIVLKAMGQAISKTVAIAEIIKKRIPGLHQETFISSTSITDIFEPIEEGLVPLEMTRQVSLISITLSTKELNKNSPGYQGPSHAEQSKDEHQSHDSQQQQHWQQHQQQQQQQHRQQHQHQQQQQQQKQVAPFVRRAYEDSYGRGRNRGRGRGRGWGWGGYGNYQENSGYSNWGRGGGRGRGWGYRGRGYGRGRGGGGRSYGRGRGRVGGRGIGPGNQA